MWAILLFTLGLITGTTAAIVFVWAWAVRNIRW